MRIQCPGCGARLRMPDKPIRVSRAKCTRCSYVFAIEPPSAGVPVAPPLALSTSDLPGILVVDDAPFFLEVIVDILKPLSVRLMTSSDGREALTLIRQERPSLVLLDLNLPGLDGFELLRAVRSDPSLRGIRLLAMSAVFRKEEDAALAMRAGADGFFNKSFRPDQLLEKVRTLLETP